MKYKLISFDFDGTLLNDESKVSDETKNTILSFKEKGYIIVGVTARNLSSSKEVVDINMLDYLIINNGSCIYDVKSNKEYSVDSISKETALDISNILKDIKCQIELITTDYYYIYKEKRNSKVPFIKDIDSIYEIEEDIARISLFLDSQSDVDYCLNIIGQKFKNVNCFVMNSGYNNSRWIAINPGKLNKYESLKLLGTNLSIETDEMIFFGDSRNDLEVIQGVGCGVAMGNAISDIKEKAKYVTLTNNEDGIKVFLEKIIN